MRFREKAVKFPMRKEPQDTPGKQKSELNVETARYMNAEQKVGFNL